MRASEPRSESLNSAKINKAFHGVLLVTGALQKQITLSLKHELFLINPKMVKGILRARHTQSTAEYQLGF